MNLLDRRLAGEGDQVQDAEANRTKAYFRNSNDVKQVERRGRMEMLIISARRGTWQIT
jgi:hypothetical protein